MKVTLFHNSIPFQEDAPTSVGAKQSRD